MEERRVWKNRFLTVCLTLFFATPILTPLASADGMDSCDPLDVGLSECDDYNSNDDGTPFQQDWIRGTYDFDLQDTTTIHLTLSWAIREFDRSKLGFDGSIDLILQGDGLDDDDGIPADMIRTYWNQDDGSGTSTTVGDRMVVETQDTIEELLSTGFGTVSAINTQTVGIYTEGGASCLLYTSPSPRD